MLSRETISAYNENRAKPAMDSVSKMQKYLLLKQVISVVTTGKE